MTTPTKKKCLAKGLTPEQEKEYMVLSPFELKNILIQKAKGNAGNDTPYLNAGRGNPNFFNVTARHAFSKLIEFALSVSIPDSDNPDLGYVPEDSTNLYNTFMEYFKGDQSHEIKFLKKGIEFACEKLRLNKDQLIWDLTDAARGDFYPSPPRIQPSIEPIIQKYLNQVLLDGLHSKGTFDLFVTEGGTAGMVYTFNSLMENFLLEKYDKVAVITPVFSPYLEIPNLNDFEFDLISIDAHEKKGWPVPDSEIAKLHDPAVKVLYLINPTNPPSVALSEETIGKIQNALKINPNLIIVVDAVYATFVEQFHSIIAKAPYNCITVYSFSKYFGVTGWRMGVIMLNEKNVIDDIIKNQINKNEKKRSILENRYKTVNTDPDHLHFIERLDLDSRDVALGHTSGVSCPVQAQMALFALFNLLDQDTYKTRLRDLLYNRNLRLFTPLDLKVPTQGNHAHYYALIDILKLAKQKYDSKNFAFYLVENFYPVDFVFCLAIDTASVCLPGFGFFEPEPISESSNTARDRNNWSIRVSIANLSTDSYGKLGKNIMQVLDMYYKDFQAQTSNSNIS